MRLIDADALGVGRCSREILPATYCAGWNGLLNLIETAPTIDPSTLRPKGEWEFIRQEFDGGGFIDIYGCSECIHEEETGIGRALANFCPNCGADMRGET